MKNQRKIYPVTAGMMLLASTSVTTAQTEQGFYIVPSVGYFSSDGNFDGSSRRNLDNNALYYGLGVGFQFNKWIGLEASYFEIDAESKDPRKDESGILRGTGTSIDGKNYRLDAIFNIPTNSALTPYLALGAGVLEFDPRFGSSNEETSLNAGGGVKYALNRNLSLRGDLRVHYNYDDEDGDYSVGLGLAYLIPTGATKVEPVEKVVKPGDSDGDGVLDDKDQCPNTPAGVSVDSNGCPLDTDGDGVPDSLDRCPGTPAGALVDEQGCPRELTDKEVRITLNVEFDTGKAIVKPQYYVEIEKAATFMRQYINTTTTIEGHTDNVGTDSSNQKLSQRRADAVRDVMVRQFGVSPTRLTAIGYGESRPIADNRTKEGKQRNRRVEAVIVAIVKASTR